MEASERTYLFLSMQLKSDTEEQEKIEYSTHQIHTPARKKWNLWQLVLSASLKRDGFLA